MAYTRGAYKSLVICDEEEYGVAPAGNTATARYLRRVEGALTLGRDIMRSEEILTSMQVRDARHGVRRVSGRLRGQLSPGAYKEFFNAILRTNWVTGTSGSIALTATATADTVTFTRGTGSFLTDGYKIGDLVWIPTVGGTPFSATENANRLNDRNMRIRILTATVMNCAYDRQYSHGVLTGSLSTLDVVTPQTVALKVRGKKALISPSNQDFKSFTIEQYFHDADTAPISELYTGCMVQSLRITVPPAGMVQFEASIIGQDMTRDSTRYFTAASAMSTDPSLNGIAGEIRVAGIERNFITGFSLQLVNQIDSPAVIGSTLVPQLFPGTLVVEGQLQGLTPDFTIQDLLLNETEGSVRLFMSSYYAANAPFVNISMNRCKFFSADKNDTDRAIVQSVGFQALEDYSGVGAGTNRDATTIMVQDNLA